MTIAAGTSGITRLRPSTSWSVELLNSGCCISSSHSPRYDGVQRPESPSLQGHAHDMTACSDDHLSPFGHS